MENRDDGGVRLGDVSDCGTIGQKKENRKEGVGFGFGLGKSFVIGDYEKIGKKEGEDEQFIVKGCGASKAWLAEQGEKARLEACETAKGLSLEREGKAPAKCVGFGGGFYGNNNGMRRNYSHTALNELIHFPELKDTDTDTETDSRKANGCGIWTAFKAVGTNGGKPRREETSNDTGLEAMLGLGISIVDEYLDGGVEPPAAEAQIVDDLYGDL